MSWHLTEQHAQTQEFVINCYIWDIVWVSANLLAVGCDDGIIRVYQLGFEKNKSLVSELRYGVSAVVLDLVQRQG